MANDAERDTQRLWQTQPGRTPMPLADIRAKAQQLATTTTRWKVITTIVFALVVLDTVWDAWTADTTVQRVGQLLLLAALAHMAYRFRTHHRSASPAFAGRAAGAEFYRAELIRQRDLAQEGWAYLLPFVPGLGLIVLDRGLEGRPAGQVTVLIALAVALFLGAAAVSGATARRLQRELDALDTDLQ